MTTNEVSKALNCCIEKLPCCNCPLCDSEDCKEELLRECYILDKNQKAKIEKLQCQIIEADRKVREFAKHLVDKSKDGVVSVSDLPDLVHSFLKGGAEE